MESIEHGVWHWKMACGAVPRQEGPIPATKAACLMSSPRQPRFVGIDFSGMTTNKWQAGAPKCAALQYGVREKWDWPKQCCSSAAQAAVICHAPAGGTGYDCTWKPLQALHKFSMEPDTQVSLLGINTTPHSAAATAHEVVSLLAESPSVQRVIVLASMHIPSAAESSVHVTSINCGGKHGHQDVPHEWLHLPGVLLCSIFDGPFVMRRAQ
jgi:hypothetical protein